LTVSDATVIDGQDQAVSWPPRIRITRRLLLRIAMSAGPLAIAFWLTSDKLDWSQLRHLSVLAVSICVMLSLSVVALLAWRWQKVTRVLLGGKVALPNLGVFASQIWVGLAANQVLPSIVVGDTLRVGLLSREGVPLGNAIGSVFLDRIYGMVGLALLAGSTALLLAPSFAIPSLGVAALVLLGTAAVAVGWRLFGSRLRAVFPVSGIPLRTSFGLVAMAMVAHLANIAIFFVVASGLGLDLPLFPAIAVMCAVQLVGALPISVAGWGVRELALIQAFGYMGLPAETIILASVTYGLILFMMQAPGFLLLARRVRP
jgi:glycosyltransferase 2 family protein